MVSTRLYYEVPKNRRYWVVRAEHGDYLDHFRAAGIAAIGHLDIVRLPSSAESIQPSEIPTILSSLDTRLKRERVHQARITSLVHQVGNFISSIKNDDLVLCPGQSTILFGRVLGPAYVDSSPVSIADSLFPDRGLVLTHALRRKISWGPIIQRDIFPRPLARSLMGNQTVFNIDNHWQVIHHLLYPVFTRDNDVYVSFRIEREYDISSYSLMSLLKFLTDSEVFIRKLGGFDEAEESFERIASNLFKSGQLSLSTKAEIMSPGDLWGTFAKVVAKNQPLLIACIIHGMIFGNSQLGIEGILDRETRHKIVEFLLERWEKGDGERIKRELKLEIPSHDTRPIEPSQTEIGAPILNDRIGQPQQ
jgi:hypothetical protein